MSETNKALVRRWFEELFNGRRLEVADEIVAPDHVDHDPTLPGTPTGPEGVKETVRLYHGAFPDAHITIEDQVAEGDLVVTRWTGRGTHRGDLMGVPPSGNEVTVPGITINRISGGKIAESWDSYDALGMMQQVGAIPAPEPARG